VIRVLVADDQGAVRAGFAALIGAEDEMQVAGQAANGREAVDLTRRLLPHVVLMDIRMPQLDGLEATRLICADPTLAGTRVLALTTFDLDEYVYAALRAGASGFLLKDAGADELLRAIRVVAAGDALIAPSITRRLIAEFTARQDPQRPPEELAALTGRETEILRLVAAGLSNAEIVGRLSSAHSPRRRTSAASSANSTVATAHSSSPSPTNAVSSRRDPPTAATEAPGTRCHSRPDVSTGVSMNAWIDASYCVSISTVPRRSVRCGSTRGQRGSLRLPSVHWAIPRG
jgi:DNA-binding NarL/FixJ family response regulator